MAAACPVLAGPTAVGKTGLICELAADFQVEVVSLDSRQIYRGLRIGTAQPSAEELAACPHHLVDFLSPEETWSAQAFREAFTRTYVEIRARGRVPLLVGGAGLYLDALAVGFFEIDAPEGALEEVRSRLDRLNGDEIRRRLQVSDPASFERIAPADRYRSQRALEIRELTGRPLSELRAEHRPDPALGLDFPLVFLDRPREVLRERIAQRLEIMLDGGWLEETRDLLDRHAADAPGMRTLGYREITAHLAGESTLDEARELIAVRTGQYAKRQQTWFRARPHAATGAPGDAVVRNTLRRLLETAAG